VELIVIVPGGHTEAGKVIGLRQSIEGALEYTFITIAYLKLMIRGEVIAAVMFEPLAKVVVCVELVAPAIFDPLFFH
jgi:hypothetical protein